MTRRIGLKAGEIHNHKIRVKTVKLRRFRLNQQILNKQRMPGQLGHHAGGQTVRCISPAKQVLHQQFLATGIGQHVLMQRIKLFGCHGFIIIPPNCVFRSGVADDEFVLRRAARMSTCFDQQCATCGDFALAARQCHFINLRWPQIPVNRGGITQSLLVNAIFAHVKASLLHDENLPVTSKQLCGADAAH